ncbi:MAG TPA: glycoside hydrolase family 99-like domain-containing protein [Candidatus Hydrogenedentes bacterium]|nr:glycoside hydrolase family 99-like domain-containing protein [Candidatus Hydrogenedentota bacterium]HOK89946.1 glycoside hydrolase family 99-like domain-containing protein [Candidatus Hydrogenedentota bacterium]
MLSTIAMGWIVLTAGMLPRWDFTDPHAAQAWSPNTDAGRQEMTAEGWRITPSGPDPQLVSVPIDVDLEGMAMLYLRLSASREGECQVFWSREDGEMMGFSESRSRRFAVSGGGEDSEIVVFPGWNSGTRLHRLRFDPFGDAEFTLKEIIVFYPFGDRAALATFPPAGKSVPMLKPPAPGEEAPESSWFQLPGERAFWCGPLDIDAKDVTGIILKSDATDSGQARPWRFSWMVSGDDQFHEAVAWLWPRRDAQWVRLDLFPGWTGRITAFGFRPPEGISCTEITPAGMDPLAPWPVISRLRALDSTWRVGRPCEILARVENRGGGVARVKGITLSAVDGEGRAIEIHPKDMAPPEDLRWGEYHDLTWEAVAHHPGPVRLRLEGMEFGGITEAECLVTDPPDILKIDYVPPPVPPRLPFDVCAYYFPGWNSPAKWYCIRDYAPERRPALGYYDEGNPECVDWQIKWSLDHGITCYLVDWYWVQGRQSLTHWFDAYRQARYRDLLKVAIMWANHNPPGTHSRQDWQNVTREWIDHYFNLPAYFRIDGKPAIFLWDPRGLRRDLGSMEAVAAALNDSQQMARDAGYPGISFVAMGYGFTSGELSNLRQAGFTGWTTYHEWEHAAARAWSQQEVSYEDIASHAPDAWQQRASLANTAGLTYYPVVDTGWDARPWHGNASMVITGRTPERLERLAAKARDFTMAGHLPFLVVGPLNEWGEGSYIEPNAEYGMAMMRALRRGVTGDTGNTPEDVYPADMGRGPFDFSMPDWQSTDWPFTPDAPWMLSGNVQNVRKESGTWRFTVTGDPATLTRNVYGINASSHPWAVLRLAVSPLDPSTKDVSPRGTVRVENLNKGVLAEQSFTVIPDGVTRDYAIDLGENNPRWTGRPARIIARLVNQPGYDVTVASISLRQAPNTSEPRQNVP